MTSYADYRPLEIAIANISLELPQRDPELFDVKVKIQDGLVYIQPMPEFHHLTLKVARGFTGGVGFSITTDGTYLSVKPVVADDWRHSACRAIAQVVTNELERGGWIVGWEDYDAER